MAQQLWACSMCGQGFTRKRSANRHNLNLHSGQALVIRTMEYIIGRVNGKFPAQLIRGYLERPIAETTITILALRLVIYIARYFISNNLDVKPVEYNTHDKRPSYPIQRPDLSTPVVQQESFDKAVNENEQSNHRYKPSEGPSIMEKLAEFKRLSYELYANLVAEDMIKMVHCRVFNFGDEGFLDDQINWLRKFKQISSEVD